MEVPTTPHIDESMQAEVTPRKGAALIRVSEIYTSIQGEGLLTGTPSVFLRTSGCNLRCSFCDTKFASWKPEGSHLKLDAIVAAVNESQAEHVVVTGGEPMIYGSLPLLTELLNNAGRHVTIETAGTLFQPVQCDLMSISPKLSNSTPTSLGQRWQQLHDLRRERLDVVRELMVYPYQLKFVIDCPADTEEVLRYLNSLSGFDPTRVLMMPQGTELQSLEQTEHWLRPWCERQGFRFSPRAHIAWFGNRRGT